VTCHALTSIMFNILLLGTLFARLNSPKNRAVTIRLSKSLLITSLEGRDDALALEFRIGEVRKYKLLNMNVSVFLYYHRENNLFIREQLLVDARGLFLAVPTEVRHVIDELSPFWNFLNNSKLNLNSSNCPICGDIFDSMAQLKIHLNHNKKISNDHLQLLKDIKSNNKINLNILKNLFRNRSSEYFEIVVLAEGTEPVTGSPIQYRQSYRSGDFVFGGQFSNCVKIKQNMKNKLIEIDFNNFDEIN
jgi:hypothetical protein